jgi:hypothetical protein
MGERGPYNRQSLAGFVDSDFAGDVVSRKSNTGFVFMLNGGAVSWGSKKQQSVATSTVEAEFIAASHAIKEGVWLGSLLKELGQSVSGVELRMDITGCIANLQNNVLSKYTKHISVCYHQAREKVAWGQITPVYVHVNTEDNVADIFTKPLPNPSFLKQRDSLSVAMEALRKGRDRETSGLDLSIWPYASYISWLCQRQINDIYLCMNLYSLSSLGPGSLALHGGTRPRGLYGTPDG